MGLGITRTAGEGIILYDAATRQIIARITVKHGGAVVGLDITADRAVGIARNELFIEQELERLGEDGCPADQAAKLRALAADIKQTRKAMLVTDERRRERSAQYGGRGGSRR